MRYSDEGDETELAAVRKRLTTAGLGLWQEAEASAGLAMDGEPRHAKAIASTEASATPNETRIVERVIAEMRALGTFTADDVSRALDREGVADTLDTRRRYSSRVTNGIRNKVSRGKVMTTLGKRSGREVTIWEIVPDAAIDTPTKEG